MKGAKVECVNHIEYAVNLFYSLASMSHRPCVNQVNSHSVLALTLTHL